jgi:hypothetical protein
MNRHTNGAEIKKKIEKKEDTARKMFICSGG